MITGEKGIDLLCINETLFERTMGDRFFIAQLGVWFILQMVAAVSAFGQDYPVTTGDVLLPIFWERSSSVPFIFEKDDLFCKQNNAHKTNLARTLLIYILLPS